MDLSEANSVGLFVDFQDFDKHDRHLAVMLKELHSPPLLIYAIENQHIRVRDANLAQMKSAGISGSYDADLSIVRHRFLKNLQLSLQPLNHVAGRIVSLSGNLPHFAHRAFEVGYRKSGHLLFS
jgi:hypothetical protein